MAPTALELELPSEWSAIKAVWDRCRAMLREAGLGEDEAYALAMVSQELLENAVKYGARDGGGVTLSLRGAIPAANPATCSPSAFAFSKTAAPTSSGFLGIEPIPDSTFLRMSSIIWEA